MIDRPLTTTEGPTTLRGEPLWGWSPARALTERRDDEGPSPSPQPGHGLAAVRLPARALGLHIGASRSTAPHLAYLRPARSAPDAVERVARLCAAAGVRRQTLLLGEAATLGHVRGEIGAAVAGLAAGGLFVLTFSGHTVRRPSLQWCLYDGGLALDEVAASVAGLPPAARLVIVADTCHAAALARSMAAARATVVLIAACGEGHMVLSRRTSELAARLERLAGPGGAPDGEPMTYARLDRELRQGTPDVERPRVWANRAEAWGLRPFE